MENFKNLYERLTDEQRLKLAEYFRTVPNSLEALIMDLKTTHFVHELPIGSAISLKNAVVTDQNEFTALQYLNIFEPKTNTDEKSTD